MPRQAGIGTRQKAILACGTLAVAGWCRQRRLHFGVARLNSEINNILASPAVKGGIAGPRGEVAPMAPAEFSAKAHEDTARFGELIKDRRTADDWRARVLTSKRIFYIK